jgi:outer membrane protein TolC
VTTTTEEDLTGVACPSCGEEMSWPRGERVTEPCDVCRASAEVRSVHLRNKSLALEVVELRAALAAIVNEPVSMLLAQAAGLVRLVGPDDWPEDAIPRGPVVDMAMRVKEAADKQRALAREAGL